MSRSIHETRAKLRKFYKYDFSDPQHAASEKKFIRKALGRKWRIKSQVRDERKPQGLGLLLKQPDEIEIRVRDESDFVHHPASADDIRAVLEQLPKGTLNALESIELLLGLHELNSFARDDEDKDEDEGHGSDKVLTDPHTGRLGHEIYPGVYCGDKLGTYMLWNMRIWLYAYVYAADHPQREVLEILCKGRVLQTLVHEIAHHQDRTLRMARGRWRMDNEEKAEDYAEQFVREWTALYVVPYLEQTYPEQVGRLLGWLRDGTGIELTLGTLLGDAYEEDQGVTPYRDSMYLDKIIEGIINGEEHAEICDDLAWRLFKSEHYSQALQAVELVLTYKPGDVEQLLFKARILGKLKRMAEAIQLARKITSKHPENWNAWNRLANLAYLDEDWPLAREASQQVIDLHPKDNGLWIWYVLFVHIRAKLKLNDLEGLEAEIDRFAKEEDAPEWYEDWLRDDLAERMEQAKQNRNPG